jgi:hypothetical protein
MMEAPICGAYQEALILHDFMRSGHVCAGCYHPIGVHAHEGKMFSMLTCYLSLNNLLAQALHLLCLQSFVFVSYHQFYSAFDLMEALTCLVLPAPLNRFIASFDLVNETLPADVLATYCTSQTDRDSTAAVALIESSTHVTSNNVRNQLSAFKFSSISKPKRPELFSFEFTEVNLRNVVMSKLTQLRDIESVLLGLVQSLSRVRCLIYAVHMANDLENVRELRAQCIMYLFLEDIFRTCSIAMEVSTAQGDNIELNVDTDSGEIIPITGFTDLKCYPTGSTSILDAIATIEMTRPFSKSGLYKTPAFQPKQQFIGQALALMQMAPCACKLSFLTDVFALSVVYHANGKVYLSRRVTDGTAFCLRLLLMCCNLSSDDWAGLIQAHCVAIDFDEAVDPPPHSNSLNSITAERSVTRSVTRDNERRV